MANVSWIGQTLNDRYSIESLLGQGGMSSVYKANDPNLRRTVAVKMIHPHLSNNPSFMRRFEEEAAIVAQLRHENIVQVYDFNHDNDVYYMVLEFIPGETLEDRLKRLNTKNRHIDLADAVKFIAQVCEAVNYAHERGMIHRDIKPANIMLDIYGKAVLMDFGIARMVGGKMHTAAGAVIGTAMYMSPEQIKGERVDERTDIYSLGVTLYEAISGKPPFEADTAMTLMMMHLNDPVPNIRDINPQVPDNLTKVVTKALEKNRDERYQTAGEMAQDLRAVYAQLTGTTSTTTRPSKTRIDQTQTDIPVDKTQADLSSEPPVPVPPLSRGRTSAASPYKEAEQVAAGEPDLPAAQAAPETSPAAPAKSLDEPGEAQPAHSAPPITATGPAVKRSSAPFRTPILISGCAVLAVIGLAALMIAGIPMLRGSGLMGSSSQPTATQEIFTPTPQATSTTAGILSAAPTSSPAAVSTATTAPAAATLPPAAAPVGAATAAPTVPSDRPFVRITSIRVENGRYVVDYQTTGFTEKLPGTNIHFFFNTVSPDQAGVPGKGPWIFFGGPRPFKGYAVNNRPQGATQLCALVANPDHTVQPNSGSCLDLPN